MDSCEVLLANWLCSLSCSYEKRLYWEAASQSACRWSVLLTDIMQTDRVVFTLDRDMTNLSYKLKYKCTHTVRFKHPSVFLPVSSMHCLYLVKLCVNEGNLSISTHGILKSVWCVHFKEENCPTIKFDFPWAAAEDLLFWEICVLLLETLHKLTVSETLNELTKSGDIFSSNASLHHWILVLPVKRSVSSEDVLQLVSNEQRSQDLVSFCLIWMHLTSSLWVSFHQFLNWPL